MNVKMEHICALKVAGTHQGNMNASVKMDMLGEKTIRHALVTFAL